MLSVAPSFLLRAPSAAPLCRAFPLCQFVMPAGLKFPSRADSSAPAAVTPRCASTKQPVGRALCRTCRLAPPPFVRAVSYGPYTGRMREAMHALKYQKLHPASRRLGQMLAHAIAQLNADAPGELLVVPVPLHRSKRRGRGFNQTQLLALEALRALRASHPGWRLTLAAGVLMRHRATGSQAGLTPRQRRLNVRNAFRVPDPEAVAGKHILVIDDILTTGATVRSAGRALIAAGAASVWVATLARARRIHAESLAADSSRAAAHREGSDQVAGEVPAAQQLASMYQRSF